MIHATQGLKTWKFSYFVLYTADACIIKNEDVLTVLIEVISFSNCMAVKRQTGNLEGIKFGAGFFTFLIERALT